MKIVIKRYNRRMDLLLAMVAVILALGSALWLHHYRSIISNYRPSYILLFIATLLGSSTVFTPAPNIPTILIHASMLPHIPVAILGGLGWGLGEVTGYFMGRTGRLQIEGISPRFQFFWTHFRPILIFVFACIPNPFYDAVGVLAGSLRVSIREFLAMTILGRIFAAMLLVNIPSAFFTRLIEWSF